MKPALLFVYNADSGLFSRLTDIAHKIISPATYACRLCAVTHSITGMQQQWQLFLDQLPVAVRFYHRDEFIREYQLPEGQFPAIYVHNGEAIRLLISAEEINRCPDLDSLQALVSQHLAALADGPDIQ